MIYPFSTDDEGRRGPNDVWFIFVRPVEPKDDVLLFDVSYRGF